MKKIWNQYCYIILLMVISFTSALFYSGHIHNEQKSNYITITISEGESLWELSEKYSSGHEFSSNEFIKWVEKNNGISGDRIYPGEVIVIPVKNQEYDGTQVASSGNY